MFLVVPDPKYRMCELDERENPSAYDECCKLWKGPSNPDARPPGEMLEATLLELVEHDVKIHLMASKCDTVAEWRDNVETLYERTQDQRHVYWWFADEDTGHESSKYQVRVMLDPSCPI